VIRARLIAGEDVGVTALNHLRLCCGMMGGSPADRAKVTIVQEPEHDPFAHYFQLQLIAASCGLGSGSDHF
jgi:hypothetical protein